MSSEIWDGNMIMIYFWICRIISHPGPAFAVAFAAHDSCGQAKVDQLQSLLRWGSENPILQPRRAVECQENREEMDGKGWKSGKIWK